MGKQEVVADVLAQLERRRSAILGFFTPALGTGGCWHFTISTLSLSRRIIQKHMRMAL